ncbi:MAG: PQQ-binding-like beta-propeller repeat protein [Candidatus Hydrogenedentes bacterium]|nr:PQQ-binding-like beta-propeller repeat protein [Candidatus Hydrogenedentota bacterium]
MGFAGPAIRNGEVYLLDRTEDKTDILRCLSLDKGTELWNYSYEALGKVSHNGSRTPPTVDDKYVYSVGLTGEFLCTDRKTHKPVWRKNLLNDFKSELPRWGVSQAPVLHGDLVIVAAQAPDAFVVAYNRVTGDLKWKSPGLGLVGYVSPTVVTLAGLEQVVAIGASNKDATQKGSTAGISLTDGSILWKYEGWQCWIPIPYPTSLPGDKLFVTGGYNAGSAILQVRKGATGLEAAEVLKLDPKTCGSQIHQPILYKDHLYVNSNSNEREDGMTCLALDGTVKWRTKPVPESEVKPAAPGATPDAKSDSPGAEALPLFERGDFILADDMIIAFDGKTGMLHLVDPSPEKYKELARAKVFDGREMWAPMALTDGKLLVRNQDTLKCLDLKRP